MTRLGVLSTLRRVQPQNIGLRGHKIRVPPRAVTTEIFTKSEVDAILNHLMIHEHWYFPIFATWLSTGLRNSELIGLTWDNINFEDGPIRIVKTLKRVEHSATRRRWSGTKNGKHRIVPMTPMLKDLLQMHQQEMMELELYDPDWCS